MVDGELNFITKLDKTGFEKGTKAVGNSLGNIKSSLKSLAKIAAAAFSVKMIYDYAKASKEAYNVQIEQETKLATIMKQRMGATDDVIDSVKQLASEQQKLGVIGDEVQLAGAQQVATFLTQADSIKTLLPAMNDLLAQQRGLEASTGDAVNIANLMGKVLQGQTSALKRVGISFSDAEEQVLKYGSESERAAMLAQVITNNVGHMNQALAQTDAGKQKQLANTMGDIKEQFGQAVMQIESVFLPGIQLLANGLSKVASIAQAAGNAIKEAFGVESDNNSAAVATATAAAAASAAQSYDDMADSAEKTKKAQENSLASFDKVIKLGDSKKDNTSPSSGSGNKNSAVTIPTKVKPVDKKGQKFNWADELKKTIKKGDWEGLGKQFADKVNKAFGRVKWDKIKGKVTKAAKGLAGGINGFAEKLNWRQIGHDIGDAIDTAFTFAYNFLKNTKWEEIGGGLGTMLSGIIEKTNFTKVGQTLGAKTNAIVKFAWGLVKNFEFAKAGLGLADIINGWFDEVDWDDLGNCLGDSVNGIIDAAFEFVTHLNFTEAAEDLTTALNNLINKLNTQKLGETVSTAFEGVWDFIGTALENINWENVGNKISEFINGINWWGILDSMFEAIGNLIKATPSFLQGVVEKLDFGNAAGMFALLFAPKLASKLLSKITGDKGVKGKLKEVGGKITEKIVGGLSSAITTLKEKLTGAGKKMGDKVKNGLDGNEVGTSFTSKFASALTTATAVISAAIVGWKIGEWIYNAAKPYIDKLTDKVLDIKSDLDGTSAKNAKSTNNQSEAGDKLTVANLKKKGAWWLSKNSSHAAIQRAANIIAEAKRLNIRINDVYYQNGYYQQALEKEKNQKKSDDIAKGLNKNSAKSTGGTGATSYSQEQMRKAYKEQALKDAKKENPVVTSDYVIQQIAKGIYDTRYKKKYNLPAYASGTVIPANFGRFAAILGDNKKEPEVVSPLSTMRQAVLEAMAMQKSKQPVKIDIYLDTRHGTRLLSKQLIDDINDIITSTGKVPIKI